MEQEQTIRDITIRVGERDFIVKSSSPEHEEMIRKAAGILNARFSTWRSKYPKEDNVAIISIAALNQCMENLSLLRKLEDVRKEIFSEEEELEDYLKNIGY